MIETIDETGKVINCYKYGYPHLSLHCIEQPIVLFDIDLETDEPVSLSFEVDLDEKPVVLHE